MLAIYIILAVIIIISILLYSIRFKIKYNESEKDKLKIINKIEIYILKVIKVKTIKIVNKENIEKKNNNYKVNAIFKLINNYLNFWEAEKRIINKKEIQRIFESINYKKINIELGVNVGNSMINAYIIALVNTIINIFFIKSQDRISLEDTNYYTYISKNIFEFKANLIIDFKFLRNIGTIIKIIIRICKINSKTKKNKKTKKQNNLTTTRNANNITI